LGYGEPIFWGVKDRCLDYNDGIERLSEASLALKEIKISKFSKIYKFFMDILIRIKDILIS